jgi:hypothetical protein
MLREDAVKVGCNPMTAFAFNRITGFVLILVLIYLTLRTVGVLPS